MSVEAVEIRHCLLPIVAYNMRCERVPYLYPSDYLGNNPMHRHNIHTHHLHGIGSRPAVIVAVVVGEARCTGRDINCALDAESDTDCFRATRQPLWWSRGGLIEGGFGNLTGCLPTGTYLACARTRHSPQPPLLMVATLQVYVRPQPQLWPITSSICNSRFQKNIQYAHRNKLGTTATMVMDSTTATASRFEEIEVTRRGAVSMDVLSSL